MCLCCLTFAERPLINRQVSGREKVYGEDMNQKQWPTVIIFLLIFISSGCIPAEVEPSASEVSRTPAPLPLPTLVPPPAALVSTTFPPTPGSVPYPLHPDMIPATLPSYIMTRDPIAATGDSALAWAQSFGLTNAELVDQTGEMMRVLSRDNEAGLYEELTFIRTSNEQVIVYSRGIDWQVSGGPTPQPTAVAPALSPAETVIDVARDFVRRHGLLPEPLIIHEFPSVDDRYQVQVTTALSSLRLTGINELPGVTVRIDNSGLVTEARIVPATFVTTGAVTVEPLDQVYAAFVQGAAQNVYFFERAQLGSIEPFDYMRFQAHSLPYGEWDDRAELVYAPLPLQPERLVPMWLITRPNDQTWDHYVEYYLLAAAGENVPRPIPTRTPLAQMGIVPESLWIVPPLIVDGENGRLYTNAVVNGITHTVSLDAVTGDLLAVFGLSGDLALDAGRNQLYVDKYPYGLTVIDTATNEPLNDIQLPPGKHSHALLQADPAAGQVLLFRDQMLLTAAPLSESWQQTIPFTLEVTTCDEPLEPLAAVQQTWFDEEARLLYLMFFDYVCASSVSYTVIIYDLNTASEVARYPGMDYLSGVAVNGRFYARSWSQMGKTFRWAWQNGQPWLKQTDRGENADGGSSGFQVDLGRGWLYEMAANGLQALDMETMAVVQTVPAPVEGQLVGFDPVTDSLYFVGNEDGLLHIWSVLELLS
jgi:hypothetical protein